MGERAARERMVFSAAQLMRRHGVVGTGLRAVLAHARAPRGSLGHYFPGGKEQLVNEAVAWGGRYAGRRVPRFMAALGEHRTPSGLFRAMTAQWADEWASAGFQAGGCPVVAAAVDCADTAESTRAAVSAAFDAWRSPVAAALVEMGVPSARAGSLATLMVSAVEGAVLISRAERSPDALHAVARELGPLLDAARAGG